MMWMDASVRLVYANIDLMTSVAKQHGNAFRNGVNHSLVPHTDIDTFKFLNENLW